MNQYELKEQAQFAFADASLVDGGDVMFVIAVFFCLYVAWLALRPPKQQRIPSLTPPEAFAEIRARLDAGSEHDQRKFVLGYWEGT